jgi:hypothetical protein
MIPTARNEKNQDGENEGSAILAALDLVKIAPVSVHGFFAVVSKTQAVKSRCTGGWAVL